MDQLSRAAKPRSPAPPRPAPPRTAPQLPPRPLPPPWQPGWVTPSARVGPKGAPTSQEDYDLILLGALWSLGTCCARCGLVGVTSMHAEGWWLEMPDGSS